MFALRVILYLYFIKCNALNFGYIIFYKIIINTLINKKKYAQLLSPEFFGLSPVNYNDIKYSILKVYLLIYTF